MILEAAAAWQVPGGRGGEREEKRGARVTREKRRGRKGPSDGLHDSISSGGRKEKIESQLESVPRVTEREGRIGKRRPGWEPPRFCVIPSN